MSDKLDDIEVKNESSPAAETNAEKIKISPPHDLPLNLDLYNYDSPDAQSCPYVLTSPRSLEACSRVGIKPVDLLQKSFEEFSGDVEPGKPLDEVCKLYDAQEKHRIILLEKCQAERDFIIWRTSCKQRSQSLSPCRRNKQHQHNKDDHICTSVHPHNVTRKSQEDILSISHSSDDQISRFRGRRSRSSSVKNRNTHPRPTSFSTPASPYFRGSSNLFVRITSPVVCAKLQSFPKNKMRLPPKDMKILEVILQKYEKQEEEEQRRAKAMHIWDREKEERERKKEIAEMQRWKNLALKQKRSVSEERFTINIDKDNEPPANEGCSARHLISPQDERMHFTPQQKRRSFRNPRNQRESESFDENRFSRFGGSQRLSRYDAQQKLKMIRLKEEQVEMRRQQIIQKRDGELKRSAEELREKIKQVKTNQYELDKAMDKWRKQIVCYQYASNVRAAEKVAELCEQKKLKIKQERLTRQAEHKKKMQQIEAEDFAKLQDMMAKLRSKDERSKAFIQEKHSTMEQSRQLAQAASDLRDLIRQRLDKDSFLKRSQQAFLDSRLQSIEPRTRYTKKEKPSDA